MHVKTWLIGCMLGVLLMVVVGGYTRLSGAGLSITEWKPIVGTLPPLSESAWQAEFIKYKASPEYQQVNQGLSFHHFKFIYAVEYLHRLLGRLLGLWFLLPLLCFWRRKHLDTNEKRGLIFIGLVGLLQGGMGWYMVKSGLVNVPYVSPIRLSIHLLFAVTLLCLFYRLWLKRMGSVVAVSYCQRRHAIVCFVLALLTLFYGGLVAGHKAGLIYNTYPLMNGSFLPIEIKGAAPLWYKALYEPAVVQWIHRWLAFVLLLMTMGLIKRYSQFKAFKNTGLMAGGLIGVQVSLGILTLVYAVPLKLALLHQLFGVSLVVLLFQFVMQTKLMESKPAP